VCSSLILGLSLLSLLSLFFVCVSSLFVFCSFLFFASLVCVSLLSPSPLPQVIAGWLSDHYSRTLLLGLIFLGRALAYVLLTTTIHNQNGDGGIVWLYTFAVLFGFCDYAGK
jgi:MFS family permease